MTLLEKNLNSMNNQQKEIVLTQWKKHQHEDFEIDFDVSGEKDMLNGFVLKKGVWNPFLASGRYHARYLFYHSDLFQEKTVIEIGSGTGLMSVIMAKYGAKKVIATDISKLSVENTKINIKKFGLEKICTVFESDLFENITEKADLITWMIPFFSGTPPKGDTISASMIMETKLFEKFLIDAKKYLNPKGVLLIPSFSLGGDFTDPAIMGKKFSYSIKTTWTHKSINGIQQGLIYMHELRLEK
ncbi:MAG: methyltransferase [archaeon]|jgi:predicted nicotinamide N-methyase